MRTRFSVGTPERRLLRGVFRASVTPDDAHDRSIHPWRMALDQVLEGAQIAGLSLAHKLIRLTDDGRGEDVVANFIQIKNSGVSTFRFRRLRDAAESSTVDGFTDEPASGPLRRNRGGSE